MHLEEEQVLALDWNQFHHCLGSLPPHHHNRPTTLINVSGLVPAESFSPTSAPPPPHFKHHHHMTSPSSVSLSRFRLCLPFDGAPLRRLRQEVQARILHLSRAAGGDNQDDVEDISLNKLKMQNQNVDNHNELDNPGLHSDCRAVQRGVIHTHNPRAL